MSVAVATAVEALDAPSSAAHESQNLAPSRLSWPQSVQRIRSPPRWWRECSSAWKRGQLTVLPRRLVAFDRHRWDSEEDVCGSPAKGWLVIRSWAIAEEVGVGGLRSSARWRIVEW